MSGQTEFQPMPPAVAKAVCDVMKAVPKLAKGEKNTHGNYNFAGIDDFLEAVRPLCAEHGLIIHQDEEKFETKEGKTGNGKTVIWLVIDYRFTLAHSSGETWAHRAKRTAMVNGSLGSQAFGAAQSYALKSYMRSLFQIATGEKDADSHEQENLPPVQNMEKKQWQGPLTKSDLKAKLHEYSVALDKIKTKPDLEKLMAAYKAVTDQAKVDWPESLASTENGVGIGKRTANALRELPDTLPEPALIPVQVNDETGETDWQGWIEKYVDAVQSAPSGEWLDGHIEANKVPFENYKKQHDEEALALVSTAINDKRGELFNNNPEEVFPNAA